MTTNAPDKAGTARNPATVWTVPEPLRAIYSHACEVRSNVRTLFISGQFGVDPQGGIPADFEGQCANAMDNVERLLADAGMTRADIVKLSYFLVRTEDAPKLAEMRRRRWATDDPPSVTMLVVSALARPDFLIEIEAVAAAQ